ncbi:MAG: class II aldolase/adducin family protein [Vulcanimicrobiaceae bacterium]
MDERAARTTIVQYGRLLWERGLVAGASGNLSVKLDDGTILVTPTLHSLRALEPVQLVRVDRDGRGLDAATRPTSELPLHLAAYRAAPAAACVIHTHPPFCIAWSKRGALFPLDTVGASESLGPIAFCAFARPGSTELADRCASWFARGAGAVVMERHGLTVVAPDLETAYLRTDLTESTAKIELFAALLADKVPGCARA